MPCKGMPWVFFSGIVFMLFPLHFVSRFMTAEPFQIGVSSAFSWLFSGVCSRSKLLFLLFSVFSAENDFPLSAKLFFIWLRFSRKCAHVVCRYALKYCFCGL